MGCKYKRMCEVWPDWGVEILEVSEPLDGALLVESAPSGVPSVVSGVRGAGVSRRARG